MGVVGDPTNAGTGGRKATPQPQTVEESMRRTYSSRYAIKCARVVGIASVNEVKLIIELNNSRSICVGETSDYWEIAAQEWYMLRLKGRSPLFAPASGAWCIYPRPLGFFIPFRVTCQSVTRKKSSPWLKLYGLTELGDRWLLARLWFYDSDFPKVVLGVDRLQKDIFCT
ncbi:MAG TPA: hypothetical protein DEP63_03900 [Candidatus Magasanikbacteria bacterium]|uniref:Uncharacterized protein n=1 Tax=Candidatus Magasanikbacteria bacterium GW2011_GWE2_42_7 TaxID=1619052 RepID=A0A0G1BGP5_9BACT|nr:MAG: hypothetical protein UV42_C0008G0011 [Candidatus Magasanikbacteria bacterium GW2011_GWE2_42_7]HBB38590.1 hypothetical protein [Candidatus Magasanikbacteria bacterium]HCC13863.1 hypothetical protein [Candidatus Magasanikbacteria bacterium]